MTCPECPLVPILATLRGMTIAETLQAYMPPAEDEP